MAIIKYHFGRIGRGSEDYGQSATLLEMRNHGNIDGLADFFLPHIQKIALFYAYQTDQPKQNYDDLFSEGCMTFLRATADYSDFAIPFQAYIKRAIVNSIESHAREINDPPRNFDLAISQNKEWLAFERNDAVSRMLQTLDPRIETILRLRYFEDLTLEEVAEQMSYNKKSLKALNLREEGHITRARVRQLERKGLRALRHLSRSVHLQPYL